MWERKGVCRVLVGKPEGRRPLGRPRHRWEDNIKMDLREVGWGHWLGQSGSRQNAVMNHRVPYSAGNFLTSWGIISLSGRTLLHWVVNFCMSTSSMVWPIYFGHGTNFVAWVIHHVKRMRGIISSPVACPVSPYFSTLSHKRYDFLEKVFECKICSDFVYNFYSKPFSFYEQFNEILS